jgi:hypothetical protein
MIQFNNVKSEIFNLLTTLDENCPTIIKKLTDCI